MGLRVKLLDVNLATDGGRRQPEAGEIQADPDCCRRVLVLA
jgi:hypothetical protein